jgi:alpha-1,3-glucosyltransferase
VLLSTPVFLFTWLWSIKSIIEAGWTAGGLSLAEPKEKKTELGIGFPSESIGPSGISSAVAPLEGIRNRREDGLRAQSLGYAMGRGRLD